MLAEVLVLFAAEIVAMAGLFYEEVALWVICLFVGDVFFEDDLAGCIVWVYVGFGYPARAFLRQLLLGYFLCELFYGPMLAFKDFAMQLIGQMFMLELGRCDSCVMIVGAILGDIGLVVIEAFVGLDRVDVFIVYLYGRVSEVQCCQMTMPTAVNVHVLAIDGDFDVAQAWLKDMFNDFAFRDSVRLVGVNSINWGWVLVQVVYYFAVVTVLGVLYRVVDFTVFIGNFGDIYVGHIARAMGLFIGWLVIVTNCNDILYRALEIGHYRTEGVIFMISLLMDIQVLLNFECVLFDVYGCDGVVVVQLMDDLRGSGSFFISQGVLQVLREGFALGCADEDETAVTITRILAAIGELLCLYSVVGVHVAEYHLFAQGHANLMVMLVTVHFVKFSDVVEAAIGICLLLSVCMVELYDWPEWVMRMSNDLHAFQILICERLSA